MIKEKTKNKSLEEGQIVIQAPEKHDGKYLWQVAKRTKVLDINSPYSYNLVATHFSQTSALAYMDDKPIGFLSAYLIPEEPKTLFIWQIGVVPQHHGKGVGFFMIKNIFCRKVFQNVTSIKTTITPSNIPSKKLFQKVSRYLQAQLTTTPFYSPMDFSDTHEKEDLITIGPFNTKPN